jgi:hypothetical protein
MIENHKSVSITGIRLEALPHASRAAWRTRP